jgi:hypothetical protein
VTPFDFERGSSRVEASAYDCVGPRAGEERCIRAQFPPLEHESHDGKMTRIPLLCECLKAALRGKTGSRKNSAIRAEKLRTTVRSTLCRASNALFSECRAA